MKATMTLHFEKAEDWVNEIEDEVDPGKHVLNVLADNKIKGEVLGKVKYEMEEGEHDCEKCKVRITTHSTKICAKCREDICRECDRHGEECGGCEMAGR